MRRFLVVLLALLASTAGAATRLPARVELQITDPHSGRAILPDGTLVWTKDFRHWGGSYRLLAPLHDLAALDRYRAYAVGTDGRLHRTLNGGGSWLTVTSAPGLDRITAAGQNRLFATNRAGRLETSGDGGTSWRMLSPTGVQSICALDTRHVLVTRSGEILRSADGGKSFATAFKVPLPRRNAGTIELTCAHGAAWATLADLGAAASQNAYVVLESPDGGRRWLPRLAEHYFPYWRAADRTANGPPQVPVVAPTGPAGAVVAGGCGACGAGETLVMITHNGGRTWSNTWDGGAFAVPPVLDSAAPLAIDFLDARHGWLIVQGDTTSPRILGTTDGGRSWAFLAEL